jgi:hypothetical protein
MQISLNEKKINKNQCKNTSNKNKLFNRIEKGKVRRIFYLPTGKNLRVEKS